MDTILIVNAGSSSVKFQVFGSGPVRSIPEWCFTSLRKKR